MLDAEAGKPRDFARELIRRAVGKAILHKLPAPFSGSSHTLLVSGRAASHCGSPEIRLTMERAKQALHVLLCFNLHRHKPLMSPYHFDKSNLRAAVFRSAPGTHDVSVILVSFIECGYVQDEGPDSCRPYAKVHSPAANKCRLLARCRQSAIALFIRCAKHRGLFLFFPLIDMHSGIGWSRRNLRVCMATAYEMRRAILAAIA
jgi:hypothetical protein